MKNNKLYLVAEFEPIMGDSCHPEELRNRLDAFREAVVPSQNFGITLTEDAGRKANESDYLAELEDYFVNNCGEDNEPLTENELQRAVATVWEVLEKSRGVRR